MPLAPRQLVLALDHAISFAREDFLEGPSNAKALALIERWPDWPDRLAVLVGPEGSGKSHLAAIWAQMTGARILSAKLLGETDLPHAFATGALVVEDLEPEGLNERALFHLINMAVDEALVTDLANRIERSFASARAAIALLDVEALRQHRPVTRALAAELFRQP